MTTTITFRIDEDLKKEAEVMFNEMGLNMTTALNMFVSATVREGKIPFEITSNQYALKKMIKEKLMEAEKEAADPNTTWLSHDEVFGKFREKYGYEV